MSDSFFFIHRLAPEEIASRMIKTRGACMAAQVPYPRTPSSESSPQGKMFRPARSPPESARTFTSASSSPESPRRFTSTGSSPESARRFTPAGSEEAVAVHNLDVEAGRDWKLNYKSSDALVIGHDEHRRAIVDFSNYTEEW